MKNRNPFISNKVFQTIFPFFSKTISHSLYIFSTFVFSSKITKNQEIYLSKLNVPNYFFPLFFFSKCYRFISLVHKKSKIKLEIKIINSIFSPHFSSRFTIHDISRNFCPEKSDGEGETMETTMSSETKLFLRKTEELSRLVSAMKRLEVHRESELLEIEKKLADLSIAVNKDRCLNAGGKFEWVDSVLVKVSIISFFLF